MYKQMMHFVMGSAFALLISFSLFYPRAFLIQQEWRQFSKNTPSFLSILEGKEEKACHWDCDIFVQIASHPQTEATNKDWTAFFPSWTSALRGLIHLFPQVSPRALSLYLSNLLLILAGAVIFQVGRELKAATPGAGLAFLPLSIFLFPYSVPSSFGYSDPLFLFLYVLAFYLLLRKHWLLAASTFGLLGITRPQGFWLSGIFSIMSLSQLFTLGRNYFRVEFKNRKVIVASAVIPVLPFLLYLCWQYHYYGDPLAFIKAQASWKRSFTFWRAFIDQAPLPKLFPMMIWTCLIGSFYFLKKRDFHWSFLGLSTFVLTELPLFSGGLMSYSRYLSTNLGMFLFVALFLSESKRKYSRYLELALILWGVLHFVTEMKEYLYAPGYCP